MMRSACRRAAERLQESPWRERIPEILRSLKQRLKGESQMRLSSV